MFYDGYIFWIGFSVLWCSCKGYLWIVICGWKSVFKYWNDLKFWIMFFDCVIDM